MIILLFILLIPTLAQAQTGTWPFQPPGATVMTDNPMNSNWVTVPGWRADFPGGGTTISDATAPLSPPSTLRYQRTHVAPGSSPGTGVNHPQASFNLGSVSSFYAGFWIKLSNPYRGWPNGFCFNKISLLWNGGTGKAYHVEIEGSDNGVCGAKKLFNGLNYDPLVNTQTGAAGNQILRANVNNPTWNSGQWTRIEVCHIRSTNPSTANGVYFAWMNGVQTHAITNLRHPGNFTDFQITPIWDSASGGGTNPIGSVDFFDIDHVHLATNFTACPGGSAPVNPDNPPGPPGTVTGVTVTVQ